MQELFLTLVRLGIGTATEADAAAVPAEGVDWEAVGALAYRQGLSAVLLDGIERCSARVRESIPLSLRRQWAGHVLQDYEGRYTVYERTIGEMTAFYAAHGLPMMVLKGYACSLDWPNPMHRPCGDIDIWQFGRQKEADALLRREKRIKVDESHHHHTVFSWNGFMVENHYDFVNVHRMRKNATWERLFKELAADPERMDKKECGGAMLYLPSAPLHGLFLLRHMMGHFAAEKITLRHVLDWAFFVRKHGAELDWKWFGDTLSQYAKTDLLHVLQAICAEDLGFGGKRPQLPPALKERVLAEILEPEFNEAMPKRLLPRIVLKYRRWRANAWKHRLCFREHLWSSFWTGVWSHLRKPSSI